MKSSVWVEVLTQDEEAGEGRLLPENRGTKTGRPARRKIQIDGAGLLFTEKSFY